MIPPYEELRRLSPSKMQFTHQIKFNSVPVSPGLGGDILFIERCRFLSRLPFSLQEWRAHYIDYPHLKKIIYAIAKAEADELQVHDEEHLGHPLLPGEMENKVTAPGDSLGADSLCAAWHAWGA